MVTLQEKINWLKEKLEGYIAGDEEYVGRIVEEYDNSFEDEEKKQLEDKIKNLLEIDITSELPPDWDEQLVKKKMVRQKNKNSKKN